jgi:hypothetical protein
MKMISLFATKLYLFIFLYKHVTYIINTTEVRVCKTHSKGFLVCEVLKEMSIIILYKYYIMSLGKMLVQ